MRLKRKKKRKRRKSLVRLASAESASRGHFDQTFSALSVRARNVLFNASVQDIPAFLAFECETLLQLPNCGRKTAAEIAAFQKRLRSDPPQDTGSSVTVPISFDNAPPGIIDAIRGRLSVRAIHVLQGLSVDDLKGFMALDYARLAGCRSCGKKTVNLILELQRDIARFAGAQAQRDGVFNPESLLDAPCLVGTVKGEQCDTPSDILCADVANPASWLTAWVLDLAKTERHARVFMLRMGMMGEEPITLEAVAKRFGGLTRERIRQMQKAVAKKAEAPVQQRRLRPLVAAAAAEVARQGGWVRLPDLTAAVLGRGSGGTQLRHATALMNFFAGLRVWREVGLCKPRFGMVTDSTHQFGVSDGKPTSHRKATRRKRRRPAFPTMEQPRLNLDFNALDLDLDELKI